MAAGNAESKANGVTGVGGIEVQARTFCGSGLIGNSRVSIFRPLSPVTPLSLRSRLPFLVQNRFGKNTFNAMYCNTFQRKKQEREISLCDL